MMSETETASPRGRYPETHRREGIKDTIESIVIALILAFVFRAFVVEAFVIPTGSMAPTLYGAHGTILCEDCGTEFAYGLRDLDDQRPIQLVRTSASAVCPNCNHVNTSLKVNDEQRNPEKGDRILVLKWPYDLGLSALDPARWDVVVFKDPSDGTTNFIKRCAGIPNEVLMILDGDVYTVPTDDLSVRAMEDLDRLRHQKHELTTGQRVGRLELPPNWLLEELDGKLKIARKTPEAQQTLWFTVYDHDHPPQSVDKGQPRWICKGGQDAGWQVKERTLHFGADSETPAAIELAQKEIRATCAYNIHSNPPPFVTDHRIRFVLTPQSETGTVWLQLNKQGRSFLATLQMDGTVSLVESRQIPPPVEPLLAAKKLPPFIVGQPVEVSFENVDYRLALYVRGVEELSTSSDTDSPAFYGPNVKQLRTARRDAGATLPRIVAAGGAFDFSHLVVERDEHYYHDTQSNQLGTADWAPGQGWGSPAAPILLRGHEYFMLGDNTAASKDSRLWDQVGPHLKSRGEDFQLGTVPRDQLIGRAFFVYWPSGHRLEWMPVLNNWGLVPDVGRMRWIR